MNKYILLIFVCEDVLISSFISVYAQVITDCTPNVRIFTDRDSFRTARVCVCVLKKVVPVCRWSVPNMKESRWREESMALNIIFSRASQCWRAGVRCVWPLSHAFPAVSPSSPALSSSPSASSWWWRDHSDWTHPEPVGERFKNTRANQQTTVALRPLRLAIYN